MGYIGGRTNTAEGVEWTRTQMYREKHGAREGLPKIVIVVTDGNPTLMVDQLEPQAQLLREIVRTCNLFIYTVIFGLNILISSLRLQKQRSLCTLNHTQLQLHY